METKEEWTDAYMYKGHYMVSNYGRVKSKKWNSEKHLKTFKRKQCGYYHIHLSIGGTVTNLRLHRLVFQSFNGKIPSGMEIDHVDGDKDNNRLYNLECVSPRVNSIRSILSRFGHKLLGSNADGGMFRSAIRTPYDRKINTITRSRSEYFCHDMYIEALKSIQDGTICDFMSDAAEYNNSQEREAYEKYAVRHEYNPNRNTEESCAR